MKDRIRRFAWLCVPLLAVLPLAGCDLPDESVELPVRAESVAMLSGGTLELGVNETRRLAAEVLPRGAGDYVLVWTADPADRVSVDQGGTIRGLRPGSATVTVALYVEGYHIDSDRLALAVHADLPEAPVENPGEDPGEAPPKDPIDPLALFQALRGRRVLTGGWADNANAGQGIAYANPGSPIVICDLRYPDPIDKLNAFTAALDLRNQPVFIIVSGDIDFSRGTISDVPGHFPGITDYRVTQDRRFDIRSSDTTIIGINDARLMFGGLRINGSMSSDTMNIIIRNLTFWDARDTRPNPGLDGLLLTGNSSANADWPTGVWIDHVKFSSGYTDYRQGGDWHDTLLNVTLGEVTVSWSRFTNANEVLLVGGGDDGEYPANADADELLRLRSRRRVTLHHNYFHEARDRMPRTRGTQMHMYNNLFRDVRNYVMGPGFNAHFVVQNNLFVAPIHMDRILNTGFNGFNTAVVWSAGNSGVGVLAGGRVSARSVDGVKPWEPGDFYGYTLAADVAGLRDLIPERAGPTLGTIGDFLTNLRD